MQEWQAAIDKSWLISNELLFYKCECIFYAIPRNVSGVKVFHINIIWSNNNIEIVHTPNSTPYHQPINSNRNITMASASNMYTVNAIIYNKISKYRWFWLFMQSDRIQSHPSIHIHLILFIYDINLPSSISVLAGFIFNIRQLIIFFI